MEVAVEYTKLKHLKSDSFCYGANESADRTDEGDPRYIRITDIKDDGSLREDTLRTLPREIAGAYLLHEGDILLARSGATVGKAFFYQEILGEACFAGYLIRFRPDKTKAYPRFIWFYTQSKIYQQEVELSTLQATIQNVSAERYGEFVVPTFPIEKQIEIATFLDRKTAAIDTLIAKKQRLIELLEEKRAALINQAVTKGLNPDVPMKDSGIPWISEIPEHWKITKLKWLSPFITVGIVITPSKYYVDEGIPCLRSLNIKPGEILSKNLVYISEESNNLLAKSKIFKGDLVCVRTGQPGTTAVVDERFENANCIDLILIRKTKKASSEFLCLQMNSEVCRSQYTVGTSGAIQQHFNVETAQNLILCDPPLGEQADIVTHCRKIIAQYNLLIQKAFVQIEKLQEYRQSLITAAVTGKLEVPVDERA